MCCRRWWRWKWVRMLLRWLWTWRRITKSLMFWQRVFCRKTLGALLTPDLPTTISVHSFMATQVGELRIRFETNLALERFHRWMNVRVLFSTRFRGKCFATFTARITPSTFMSVSNMPLQVRCVSEYLQKKRNQDTELLNNFFPPFL